LDLGLGCRIGIGIGIWNLLLPIWLFFVFFFAMISVSDLTSALDLEWGLVLVWFGCCCLAM
jgi:hypothetical protein